MSVALPCCASCHHWNQNEHRPWCGTCLLHSPPGLGGTAAVELDAAGNVIVDTQMSEEPFTLFLYEYDHDGHTYMFELPATSREDADARLAKLAWARFVGGNATKIPARYGWYARLLVWWRNWRRKR